MILIESNRDDHSTIEVLDWLYHLGEKNIKKVTDNIEIETASFYIGSSSNQSSIKFSQEDSIHIKDIKSNWYRRGIIGIRTELANPLANDDISENLKNYLSYHNRQIADYIIENLSTHSLNRHNDTKINKLKVLAIAAKIGLNIPETIISNDIDEILKFTKNSEFVIIKPVGFSSVKFRSDCMLTELSQDVKKTTFSKLAIYFFTNKIKKIGFTFVQFYIEKKYEIRSFYIDGNFYSMAIFSQSAENTKTDYRNYDPVNPNRCIPYSLPSDVEKKLKMLMAELDINCGSFDIICTPENSYVFLEINPIGQFSWVSKNCNYFLEKKIATFLLNG